jgi:hypothetical protein
VSSSGCFAYRSYAAGLRKQYQEVRAFMASEDAYKNIELSVNSGYLV